MDTPANLNTFLGIMAFYAILTYVVFPFVYYNFVEKTLKGAGKGFILGSVVSVLLWALVGSKMV
jgi:uncharacterized membrane protein